MTSITHKTMYIEVQTVHWDAKPCSLYVIGM